MNRIALPVLALLSLSLVHCAAASPEDADVAVDVDTELSPEAAVAAPTTAEPATADAAEKGKKGKKVETFYVVTMENVFVSSY